MLRKAGIATALLLALPAFANAWTLTAKIGSGQGSITAPKGGATAAFGTYSGGTDYNLTKTTVAVIGYFKTAAASQSITLAPATNNLVSSVILDGANVTSQGVNGVYTISGGSPAKNHSLVVYYTGTTASVAVTQAAGGVVAIQHLDATGKPFGAYSRSGFGGLKIGAKVRVYASPNSDSRVVAGNGFTDGLQGEPQYKDITIGAGVNSVTASFATVASVTGASVIAVDPATGKVNSVFPVGSSIKLVANSKASTAVNFLWSGCGLDGKTGATQTLTAATSCTATVTATSSVDGQQHMDASVAISVPTAQQVVFDTCGGCHNQRNAGLIAKFTGSAHWTNPLNNGDRAVAGDGLGTCATQKCHFKSVEQPGCNTCHSGKLNADGTFAHYTATHSDYTVKATPQTTCFVCHSGAKHGTQPNNFLKGAHNTGDHAKLYYNMDQRACLACHDAHSTVATYAGCNTCHKPATPYGVYTNLSATRLAKPHGNINKVATIKTGNPTKIGWYGGNRYALANYSTSFVTPADSCAECHGHNNTINGQYGENYHSKNNRWKSSSSRAWKYQGYSTAATPAEVSTDGCVRCHTTTGYVNFVTSNFQNLKAWGYQEAGYTEANTAAAANNTNTVSEAVTCRACHIGAEGVVRAVPAAQAYYNVTTVPFGKINSNMVQYSDFKNSNVCIPCHMGRNGANDGKSISAFAAKFAALTNVTSLTIVNVKVDPSSIPHGVNQAGVLDAKLGYTFGKTFANSSTSHATVGVGGDKATNAVSGPCVTCHMTNDGGFRNHTFDVVVDGKTPNVCVTCHGPNFNADSITAAEEAFNTSLKALAEVLADEKLNFTGTPIFKYDAGLDSHGAVIGFSWANAGGGAGQNSAGVKYDFAGKAADLEKVLGAVYNYNLLKNDVGAYAHNPAYAKWLIAQSIDAVRATGAIVSGVQTKTTKSAVDAIAQITPSSRMTADEITEAGEFVNATHFSNSNAAYKVQYVVDNSSINCATCHNPAESDLQGAARAAWGKSGHGEVTALPWIPASNHLWRNAGQAASFADVSGGSDCVRCHTPEGFAQFVGGATPFTNITPVASAADAATNSPLACNACHTNALTATSERLAVPQVTTFYNISAAGLKSHVSATFPNVGESNMCIPCHAGRVSGATLADAAGKGLNLNGGFQNSHYMAAAGLMYVKVGFSAFTSATANSGDGKGGTASYGQTMTSDADNTVSVTGATVVGKLTSTHRKLGTTAIRNDSHNPTFFVAGNLDSNGPCVTCHLQGYTNAGTKRPGAGHSLGIDDAAWNQVCNNCHSSEGLIMVEEQKEPYAAAMAMLKTLVETKLGCEYDSANYPYFFKAGFAHTSANAFKAFGNVKAEGAAFNLNLLTREPYAYVHARTYTRRLIYDSIDYLDDGVMNQSVSTYVATVYGARPANAAGTSATDAIWQYVNAYDRTSKAWLAPERP